MTIAVASSTSTKQTVPHSVPIVILGTDAVLAALPATAVQLAHACLEAGFVSVLPASWGDELIAAATLRRLPDFGDGPVIHCSCPMVAHRLLSVSSDLRPVLLPLVPPPVALARYVRALSQPNRARVTYVGGCPGAIDESIDIRMTPEALLSMLAERHIDIDEQPRVFESFIPADRRRFRSQPGGLPTADMLWSDYGARSLVEIEGDDLAAEVAQHVLGGRNVLIDAAVKLGCVCSGATAGQATKDARAFLALLEPARASAAIVDEKTPIELDLPVPAAARTPADIMAVPSMPAPNYASLGRSIDLPINASFSPPRGVVAVPEPRPPQRNGSSAPRPTVGGSSPVVRQPDGKEGKTLPRAYVARRRLSPKSTPVIPAEPFADEPIATRQEIEQPEPIYSVELIEVEVPATDSEPIVPPTTGSNESGDATEVHDTVAAAGANKIETPVAEVVEELEPASFDYNNTPMALHAMAAAESAETDQLPSVSQRVDRAEREVDEHLDVAIPLSHWTEPATPAAQSKNSEAPGDQWAGNGDRPESVPRATAHRALRTETVFDTPPSVSTVSAVATEAALPPAPLNARHVVMMLLAVVAVAIAVSATVAIFVERQFAPRTTSSTSTDR